MRLAMMRRLWLPLVLSTCLAMPGLAQTPENQPNNDLSDWGRNLGERLGEGLQRGLDGVEDLTQRFGPALGDFVNAMGPALADLLDTVEDWTLYHPPEVLPNGDIVIRRRQPDTQDNAPEQQTAPTTPDEGIDL